jgi:uridine kinase
MQTPSSLATALALVDRMSSALVLLAVDGHSASGKTSLARALLTARPGATLVHTDDFYRPMEAGARAALDAAGGYAGYYDWQRLEAELLRPLRSGSRARFRRYDWGRNDLGDWSEVEPAGLVVIEGCYSARPELRAWYAAVVLVVSSPAERARRQSRRNDASADWLARWDAAERHYMEGYRPETYADAVVSGESPTA